MKVTEEILRKCDLSNEERKVLRYYYSLPLSVKAKRWVRELGGPKYRVYFQSGQEKLVQVLKTKRARN